MFILFMFTCFIFVPHPPKKNTGHDLTAILILYSNSNFHFFFFFNVDMIFSIFTTNIQKLEQDYRVEHYGRLYAKSQIGLEIALFFKLEH